MSKDGIINQDLQKRLHQLERELTEAKAALKNERDCCQEIENALKQSKEQQHLFFENLLDGYALHEIIYGETGHPADYKFLFVNSAFEELTGLHRDWIIGKTVSEVLPETESNWIDVYGQVAITGKSTRFENYSQVVGGKWYEVSAFRPAKGQFVTLVRDITDRKNTEVALLESEEKYRQIVDTAEEGIWLLDKKGKTTFVNDKMAEMLKYPPDAMLGKSLFDFMDNEGELIAAKNLKRREQGISEQHDFKFCCQDGSELWAIVSTNPILDENSEYQGAIGMITDITERRQAQMDLERYARRLEVMREIDRAILEARAPIAVANELIEQLQHFLPIVRASVLLIDWEAYTGEVLASYSQMETQIMPGTRRPLADFGLQPELLSTDLIIRDDLSAVDSLSLVTEKLTEEGITCFIGVPMVSQGIVLGILYLAPANRREFTSEHLEIARELAHSLAVVIQQAKLTEQVQQHTRELEARVIDRTAELQAANEQLKELDRLKSKFVSDITHELRTPVTNMLLYLDLIRFNGSEKREHYLQVLSEQIYRLRHLVEDSLDLSRLDVAHKEVEFVPVVLNSIIEKNVAELRERAEHKGLKLCFQSVGVLSEVPAVHGKLERMIEGLLENAVNFTLAGQIQVSTTLDEVLGTAVITFQDTGIGFTEEDLKHCFEPFYRGSRVGQLDIPGNGLGLVLVQRIVDLHNGRITIESEVDKGSTVTVWLPLEQ